VVKRWSGEKDKEVLQIGRQWIAFEYKGSAPISNIVFARKSTVQKAFSKEINWHGMLGDQIFFLPDWCQVTNMSDTFWKPCKSTDGVWLCALVEGTYEPGILALLSAIIRFCGLSESDLKQVQCDQLFKWKAPPPTYKNVAPKIEARVSRFHKLIGGTILEELGPVLAW